MCYNFDMETFLKADIFFFVTTVIAVLFAVLGIVGVYYVIKILRDVSYLSQRAREEGDKIINSVDEIREEISKGGKKFSGGISLFSKSIARQIKKLMGKNEK